MWASSRSCGKPSLQRPDKTSKTSSQPPSLDRKERREHAKPGGGKLGHKGHSRQMCADPDKITDHLALHCPDCLEVLQSGEQDLIGEYEAIEPPASKPFVERRRRFGCRCLGCGLYVEAALPAAACGTPFGARIHALANYLKTFRALSYQRLQGLLRDVFGLSISQGGLMNMFARRHGVFQSETDKAVAQLRKADVVASDETDVRIEGTNAYHWVFRSSDVVVHTPDFTRSAEVVRTMMDGHLSLGIGSLQRPAKAWQSASDMPGASGPRYSHCQ